MSAPRGKRMSSRPKPTSIRRHSTHLPPGHLGEWRRHSAKLAQARGPCLRCHDRRHRDLQEPAGLYGNPADFAGIDGLTVVSVPVPERS